jgi:YVTN family beta-propeller protein
VRGTDREKQKAQWEVAMWKSGAIFVFAMSLGMVFSDLASAAGSAVCPVTGAGGVGGRGDVVYVSRVFEGEVAVIDVQTDILIRLLRTGPFPAGIGVAPDLDRAFVADLEDGTVTVIDSTEHAIEAVVELGVPVATVGVDEADRRVYVLDFSNGTPGTDLHVIDAENLVELDAFTVGSRIQNIAVAIADDIAYVTDFVEGVNEVDTTAGLVVRNLPVADLAHGVAVDEAADRLYVTRLENDSVSIVDTVTFTVVNSLTVGDAPQWVALDRPRAKAFVSNEADGTISVIDTTTGTVNPTVIPVGPGPLTITVHEGEGKAYVYNTGDGTISVIDTATETVLATLSPLFADGFESGDTSAWMATSP